MDALSLDPLAAGLPRVLRHVGPPAAPWPAGMVRLGETAGLLVAAELLPSSAFGAPSEHLARALEVYRTPTGHLVLMPHVVQRVPRGPVDGVGGAITLAVSMVRGIMAAGDEALDTTGEWWLTGEGRPVFVPVAAAAPIRAAAAELLQALDAGDGQQVFDALAEELVDPEPLPLDGWEDRLFAVGRASAVRPRTDEAMATRRERRHTPTRSIRGRLPRARGGSAVGRGLRDTASDAGVTLWQALRRERPARRPLMLGVAAVAAAVVLGVGLTWPDSASEPQQVAAAVPTPLPGDHPSGQGAQAEPGGDAQDAEREPPLADADLAGTAMTLMAQLRGCGDDAVCRAGVMEDPAKDLPSGPAVDDGAGTATLIDDLGGIAVVRVDGAGTGQIVLIVARDGKWLVRDVYDVADQP